MAHPFSARASATAGAPHALRDGFQAGGADAPRALSRCLSFANHTLGRVDWGMMPPSAGCFPMSCVAATADDPRPSGLRLLVTVQVCDVLPCRATPTPRAVMTECPPGGFIGLARLGLGFTEGRLGPCPADPRDFCAALGCPNDCGGDRGACVNPSGMPGAGACVCHPGYVGEACGEVACTSAACAARGATCSTSSGRCVAANGTQLLGDAVVDPPGIHAAGSRIVSFAPAAATADTSSSSWASTASAPPLAALALAVLAM